MSNFDEQFPGATFEKDDPLLPTWLQFHQQNCVWQILCREKCHRGRMEDGGKTAAEPSPRARAKSNRT